MQSSQNITPKIIAHRGYSEKFPENTMVSFQKAIQYGADGIELDIHLSKDGHLVVHHDTELGNSDNGEGYIFEKDVAFIKTLDAGSYFSQEFAHEQIPLLADVFSFFKDSIYYEIEIKVPKEDAIYKAIEIVKNNNCLDRVEFTSAYPYVLSAIKKTEPLAKCGMFVSQYPAWMKADLGEKLIRENVSLGEIDVVHLSLDQLHTGFINTLHQDGWLVHAVNCNTDEAIAKAISFCVDQFSTNKVELAVHLRNSF